MIVHFAAIEFDFALVLLNLERTQNTNNGWPNQTSVKKLDKILKLCCISDFEASLQGFAALEMESIKEQTCELRENLETIQRKDADCTDI